MTALLWGSELSPFFLKVEALCRHAGLPTERRPDGGSALENLRLMTRLRIAQARRTIQRWPSSDPNDEYPLVPYLFTADGAIHYDSSGIAGWLDAEPPGDAEPLIPREPALAFVCKLIEEALDEVGLYLVHHHRWVVSRGDNDAGERLAREFRSLVPAILQPLIANGFSRRQTRRLPYLFSVAPATKSWSPGRWPDPPSRPGFPATHRRLEDSWDELVDAAEQLLQQQPYLLGDRFTLADAALHGQLGMNLSDPSSERRLRERAPRLRGWLGAIAAGRHVGSRGELRLHPDLAPLLTWVQRDFIPLMRANAAAAASVPPRGSRNEAAFNRRRDLFEFAWRDAPARMAVKRFQLRTWSELCEQARALSAQDVALLPVASGTAWLPEWQTSSKA
ncbi:MAG: glutathione S-transferase C-terminal domain-containing protein [Stagnimonas sp.]|nr:glutathione S-transferase C-terminal domain-containing protein [Stagnimonas sp.]